MSERIATALLGLVCTVVGVLLGWYLKELSRSRKEQSDRYHEALIGVRRALEEALRVSRTGYMADTKLYEAYMAALSRLEPYANRVGTDDFRELRNIAPGEMFHLDPPLGRANTIVNKLLSKSRVF